MAWRNLLIFLKLFRNVKEISIFANFFGGLRPRSGKIFGSGADFKRGLFPVAGEDAREPEGRSGFTYSQDFWRLPQALTAFAVKL